MNKPVEQENISLECLNRYRSSLCSHLLAALREQASQQEREQLTPEQQEVVVGEIVAALYNALASQDAKHLANALPGLTDMDCSSSNEGRPSLCALLYRSSQKAISPCIQEDTEQGMMILNAVAEILFAVNSYEVQRLHQDLEACKQVEEALKQSEMRYRAVVEDQTDLICRFRPDGTLTFVNDAYCRYFGKQREDIIGPTFPSILPVDDEQKARKYYALFQGQDAAVTTHRVISAAGEVRWQEWTDRPIFDAQGRLLEFQSVGRDITDSVRAEQGLQIQRDLAIAISSTTDEADVLNHVLNAMLQLEGVDSGSVYLVDASTGQLDIVMQRGFSQQFFHDLASPTLSQFLAELVLKGTPIYGTAEELFDTPESYQNEDIRALAIIPVWSEGKIVAALYLASHASEKIPASTRQIMELIATQIGGVIGRVRAEAALKESENHLQMLFEQLTHWVNELEQHVRDITLLNGMGEYLQTCLCERDVYAVVEQFAEQLFPDHSGALYMLDSAHNVAEVVAQWGDAVPEFVVFAATDCWALRRGQSHIVDEAYHGPRCNHMARGTSCDISYLCVPMIAQGKILGVFQLYNGLNQTHEMRERWVQLVTMVAEHVAMALANLHLREKLQEQAIRDPLTGLFNRRYLDDALVRELNRAIRRNRSIGIVMIDIDHFKNFNDTYGHDAGDAMLRAVGDFLLRHIRGEDIACRYGGEEFTLILPDATLEDTQKKAEDLLGHIRHLQIQHRGSLLVAITVSVGVASFPDCGPNIDLVLRAADMALLRAKERGRNQVVVADPL